MDVSGHVRKCREGRKPLSTPIHGFGPPRFGLPLGLDVDPSFWPALYYEPGDGINPQPHYDGNLYRGRRLAVIYVVRDDAESLLHFEGEPVRAPEGSVVVFEGDRLRHSVPPQRTLGLRLVVNILFCEAPCVRTIGVTTSKYGG